MTGTVLVVEDDAALRASLCDTLRLAGIEEGVSGSVLGERR